MEGGLALTRAAPERPLARSTLADVWCISCSVGSAARGVGGLVSGISSNLSCSTFHARVAAGLAMSRRSICSSQVWYYNNPAMLDDHCTVTVELRSASPVVRTRCRSVGLVPLVTSQLAHTPTFNTTDGYHYQLVSGQAQWNPFGYAETVDISNTSIEYSR